MTQTIKTPPASGAGKSGQSSRSNPVCLEVTLTIRTLPGEQGGAAEPFREEVKTVIVFDNGAVLRSTRNMAAGQKVIVSNQSGQDVVCRVVGGQNLPSVKGYVEVEFIEPVSNFWKIQQQPAGASGSASNPIIPLPKVAPPVAPVLEPPPMYRTADTVPVAAADANVPSGSGPSFEDIAGLISMPSTPATPEPKPKPDRSTLGAKPKPTSDYGRSEDTKTSSVGDWTPPGAEVPATSQKVAARAESSSSATPVPGNTPSRDFMSKGLMAYDRSASAGGTKGRAPLVIGIAAVALVAAGVAMFVLRGPGKSSAPAMDMGALTRVTTPSYPSVSSTPPPAVAENQPPAKTETQSLPDDLDQPPAAPGLTAVPAVVKDAGAPDSRAGVRTTRSTEKNTVLTKPVEKTPPAEKTPPHAPAISNLKMSSPSAPNKNSASTGDSTTAMNDVAATEPAPSATPASLLTSAGRTSQPPVAPPSAPAAATIAATGAPSVREPKLISSTKPVYPMTARQASIEGDVVVSVSIGANGAIVGATAVSGPLSLRQAAVDSVKQWKYAPGLTDGKPAPSQVTVNIQFRLK